MKEIEVGEANFKGVDKIIDQLAKDKGQDQKPQDSQRRVVTRSRVKELGIEVPELYPTRKESPKTDSLIQERHEETQEFPEAETAHEKSRDSIWIFPMIHDKR